MAIKLEIQPYCESCCDFEADVTKPERISRFNEEYFITCIHQTDTIIKCKYANRCANLVRHLSKKIKEDKQ